MRLAWVLLACVCNPTVILSLPLQANGTVSRTSQALATGSHDASKAAPVPIYAAIPPNPDLPHDQTTELRDASTSAPPLRAPLAAVVVVGHPLAPNAMEQRQQIIAALVAAIKVMLVLLALSVCCLIYMSKEVGKMKQAIQFRLWKRR